MTHSIPLLYMLCLGLAVGLSGCGEERNSPHDAVEKKLMQFDVRYPTTSVKSRVTDAGFEQGDRVGVYITESGEALQVGGNYVNNASLTYKSTTWIPDSPIYWNEGTYDVYAYYPYTTSVLSVDNLSFTVASDQSTETTVNALGGYEASDFLWASAQRQTASSRAVPLQFKHCMSKLVVRLIKGQDFGEEEIPEADVYIHSTVRTATVDLAGGVAVKDMYVGESTLKARPVGGNRYIAIVVPQRIDNRKLLVEVVMQGVSYTLESSFVFKPGVQHTISLVIPRNPEQMKIEIGGEMEDWEAEKQ